LSRRNQFIIYTFLIGIEIELEIGIEIEIDVVMYRYARAVRAEHSRIVRIVE